MFWLLRFIHANRQTFIVILTPIVLLPLPLVGRCSEARCAFTILLMGVYWITEALPLAVTSLIPLIIFPLTGILKASQVGVLYFKDTNWLIFGSLMIAVAIETSGLHRRLAIRVLLVTGVQPRRLMLGFMSVTFFLSMWISNTATTAMMIPISEAILKELDSDEEDGNVGTKECMHSRDEAISGSIRGSLKIDCQSVCECEGGESFIKDKFHSSTETDLSKKPKRRRSTSIVKGLTICVPYAASIGGSASLTGAGPNVVLSGEYEELFPNAEPKLSFGVWITYCLPQALAILILTYIWLCFWFIGFRQIPGDQQKEKRARQVVKKEYEKLGNIKWEEVMVAIIFITTTLLWFFRAPGYMPGWSIIFPGGFVTDGTVAVTMAFLLFFLPKRRPDCFRQSCSKVRQKHSPAVLDWQTAQNMFPWNITLLFGAGFAIASASTSSGLSSLIGQQLSLLRGIDDWVICLAMTTFVCLVTETTSNTATSALFTPILAELAKTLKIHPLYLMFPPIVGANFAFMLPVATPPNAIAFSYGRITVWDLVKAGWLVNIFSIAALTISVNTFGVSLFNLREFPEWANVTEPAGNP